MVEVEPTDPFLADEIPVGDKTVNAFGPEQPDESFNDCLARSFQLEFPFLDRRLNICHAKHEDVDVEIPELPVCTVHTQHQSGLDGRQREYHPCHKVKVEGVLGYEPLDAAKVGVSFNRGRHCRRKFMEAYGLHHT